MVMLFLLSALYSQQLSAPSLIVQYADGSSQTFAAEPEEGDDFLPAWTRAEQACRTAPGRESVRINTGTYRFSAGARLLGGVDYVGAGSDAVTFTNLNAAHVGSVVFAGSNGWTGVFEAADDWSLSGVTIRQMDCTSAASHCLFAGSSHRVRLADVVVRDAKHEGIVFGGTHLFAYRCRAYDCGEGSQFRSHTGAGLNLNVHGLRAVECETYRCGQGFECGANDMRFVKCRAIGGLTSTPFGDGNLYGFNLGNSGQGCCRVRLIDCASSGHPTAVGFGNVLGRCGGLDVVRFYSINGTIGIAEGRINNNVAPPAEFVYPPNLPNVVRDSTFEFTSSAHACVLKSHFASAPDWTQWADAPTAFVGNTVVYAGVADPIHAPFGSFGARTSAITIRNNAIRGLATKPQQGWIHVGPLVNNWPMAMFPIVAEGNRADGVYTGVIVRIGL